MYFLKLLESNETVEYANERELHELARLLTAIAGKFNFEMSSAS